MFFARKPYNMGYIVVTILVAVCATVKCLLDVPENDSSIIQKLDPVQYHTLQDDNGNSHVVDLWVKASNILDSAKYDPSSENIYYLYTRDNFSTAAEYSIDMLKQSRRGTTFELVAAGSNPNVGQVLVYMNNDTLTSSFYDASKPNVIIMHGWMNNGFSDVIKVIRNATLKAANCNVMVVDWGDGANTEYATAVENTVKSGQAVACFINWLFNQTNTSPSSCHIIGHSLGGHQAGIVGRNLISPPEYITALDPAMPGWVQNVNKLRSGDGKNTAAIHTNAGVLGFLTPLCNQDFYPNGGNSMPGCIGNPACDHSRSYQYFGESITSGGFTATKCESYSQALLGACKSSITLPMGGLTPNTGQSGVFYLKTNSDPPYSMG